ncbi:MAG: hypothetical protein QNJ31_04105 [Candidatus Caenarcaniphilales bacterium]|nr:hypothetical protein [Candidatus Caenarcaniphilales bacterium]
MGIGSVSGPPDFDPMAALNKIQDQKFNQLQSQTSGVETENNGSPNKIDKKDIDSSTANSADGATNQVSNTTSTPTGDSSVGGTLDTSA